MTSGRPDDGLATRFTELVGTRLPIVQTGMGWVSGVSLTAATSNAGGFGIIAATTMDAEQLAMSLLDLRTRTDAPFGVNFRADQPDLERRLEPVLAAGVRLISFAGPPSRTVVDRVHDAGLLVMPTVGARRHAEKMRDLGVDAVIAQGSEGGGHTGHVPTSVLLPEVIDAVGDDIPVLAAGGFRDGRGLAAALAAGADGVAMGTRFLLTAESRVPDAVKQQYLAASTTDTVVTTSIDGMPQRVIRTDFVKSVSADGLVRRARSALSATRSLRHVTGASWQDLVREGLAMKRGQDRTWLQTLLAANAPMLIRAALVEGRTDAGILPTGQVVGAIDDLPTVAELLHEIEGDARRALSPRETAR